MSTIATCGRIALWLLSAVTAAERSHKAMRQHVAIVDMAVA